MVAPTSKDNYIGWRTVCSGHNLYSWKNGQLHTYSSSFPASLCCWGQFGPSSVKQSRLEHIPETAVKRLWNKDSGKKKLYLFQRASDISPHLCTCEKTSCSILNHCCLMYWDFGGNRQGIASMPIKVYDAYLLVQKQYTLSKEQITTKKKNQNRETV